ncbi:3-hydroxyisobutyryl-CoA hydrolase, mitochondrial-like [Chironomus tepperi]|uniref:3-hydroxyisobutyryl-CoA hydrolase, mitochondrial-like n=1 Tax=Chironomus tepperi TaxID=113505 RepID=UPI00391EED84
MLFSKFNKNLMLLGRNVCSKADPYFVHNERNNCGVLQLYRPKALNAINRDTFEHLYVLLNELQHRNNLVIFKGNDKIFSSGGDIKEIIKFTSLDQPKDYFQHTLNLFRLVHNYKVPFIPLMNGVCYGSASILTVAAKKYRVATEKTDFAMPEAKIGGVTDNGSSYFLSRVPRNIGYYIALASPRIKGYDMIKIGLADYYIESERLPELEDELVKSKNTDDIERTLKKFTSEPPKHTELDTLIKEIDKCFDGDTVEEIIDNLNLNGSDWAMEILRSMNKNSPTSLKLCHKGQTLGKSMSLDDCLKMEYRVAVHHFTGIGDFSEGVRALLIDRDNNPQWKFKALHEVTDEYMDQFFKPLDDQRELVFKD